MDGVTEQQEEELIKKWAESRRAALETARKIMLGPPRNGYARKLTGAFASCFSLPSGGPSAPGRRLAKRPLDPAYT